MYEYVSYLVKLNILFTFAFEDTLEMNRGERQKEETEGETGREEESDKLKGDRTGRETEMEIERAPERWEAEKEEEGDREGSSSSLGAPSRRCRIACVRVHSGIAR